MKTYSILILIIFIYVAWLFYASMGQLEFMGMTTSESEFEYDFSIKDTDFYLDYSEREQELLNKGLVDVQVVNPSIQVALAYATRDNFTKSILYTDIKRALLQKVVANKLAIAQQNLQAIDSSLSLLVLDALRPQSTQYELWEWAKLNNQQKYVAAPWSGSNHNYGCAVDVTIVGSDSMLDMGTIYDFFGPAAEPRYQWDLLNEGKLSQNQIDNRLLLKKVMKAGGFYPILSEWWHFNGLTKESARKYFEIIP